MVQHLKRKMLQTGLAMSLFIAPISYGKINKFRRIIVIGSSLTETIYALGGQGRIVGVDLTSTYPLEVQSKVKLGYMRNLSIEGLISLNPDLVMLSKDAGPPLVIEQLKRFGIATELFPVCMNIDDVKNQITRVGSILDLKIQSNHLNEQVNQAWLQTQNSIARSLEHAKGKNRNQLSVVFLMTHIPGKMMASGHGTSAHMVLKMLQLKNRFTFDGYKPISAESLIYVNPDVILMTEQGVKALGGIEHVWRIPGLENVAASKVQACIQMDANYLLAFGPRLPYAIADLNEQLNRIVVRNN